MNKPTNINELQKAQEQRIKENTKARAVKRVPRR